MTDAGLEIQDLMIRFGGHVAVNRLSLRAPLGQITGLIGPNGAGKTTTFNACSGFLRPSGGQVRLLGRDVSRVSAAGRARRGLGRTFQRMELFDSMSVAQNVGVGREARLAGALPWRHVFSRRSERAGTAAAVERALARCGLVDLADTPVGSLSTGKRRLVELARALAGDFRFLLLDEPSSGLDPSETEEFGRILTEVASEGVGILLVEHDMVLVMGICDYLYVLDFGTLIFEGTPAEVQSSSVVRAAYLGAQDGLEAVDQGAS